MRFMRPHLTEPEAPANREKSSPHGTQQSAAPLPSKSRAFFICSSVFGPMPWTRFSMSAASASHEQQLLLTGRRGGALLALFEEFLKGFTHAAQPNEAAEASQRLF